MKKGTVLNSDISSVISRLGHTDTLVVCDAGLPIPKSTTRIDMALTQGVPSFMQVLGVVTNEMQVVLTPKSWTVKHEAYRSDSDIQLESDLLIQANSSAVVVFNIFRNSILQFAYITELIKIKTLRL